MRPGGRRLNSGCRSGFTLEAGLTKVDIYEAQLKSKMIAAADSVVALIDSNKFGQAHLTAFARSNQITRLFVDSGLNRRWLARLKRAGMAFTLCERASDENER